MRMRHATSSSTSAGSRTLTAPSSTSECPLSAFVPDVIAKSAPWSSGCRPSGVATVLSTANSAPVARAAAETASRSQTSSRGLEGVSTHTSVAPSAAATIASVSVGTIRTSMPFGSRSLAREVADAWVAVAARDEHVAGAQARQHDGGDRGHARGEDDRRSAVQLADRALERRPGRVGVAAVAVRGRVGVAAQMEGSGEHGPGQDRLALRGRRQTGVHAPCTGSVAHRATVTSAGDATPRGGDAARRAGLAGECGGAALAARCGRRGRLGGPASGHRDLRGAHRRPVARTRAGPPGADRQRAEGDADDRLPAPVRRARPSARRWRPRPAAADDPPLGQRDGHARSATSSATVRWSGSPGAQG